MTVEIDGSQGEGGGQILRTALTLSIITHQPVHIYNIRANRRKPGLAPQHLAGIRAAAQICEASVEGARLHSRAITFTPGVPARAGEYYFDISQLAGQGSAGAVTLLLQAIWLPLALAQGTSWLTLRGGTHVAWSPPAHYVEWVLFPALARIGVTAALRLGQWGWYPQGGGQVEVTISGQAKLRGIDLSERGALISLQGVGAASNLPAHIAQRITNRANNVLREAGLPPQVVAERASGPSTGAGVVIAAQYEQAAAGFTALGARGKPSEEVADEATGALIAFHQQRMALDRHLPDQLLPALALAEGESSLTMCEITRHTLTNAAIIRRLVEREIVIEGQEGEPGVVRVR